MTQIKETAASVALAADEIAQGNTELSSRTEEQAAALQETAASMEQLTATVKSQHRRCTADRRVRPRDRADGGWRQGKGATT